MRARHNRVRSGRRSAMAAVRLGLLAIGLIPSVMCAADAGTSGTPDTHCLWRISDGTNHVYIQGSIHVLKKGHYPLPEPIEKAYADAEVLVLEADLSAAQDPDQQLALLKRGMLQGKTTLRDRLSESTWQLAEKQVAEMGMSMALFNAFKPWYFAMTITVVRMQTLGFSAEDGVDWHFFYRAQNDGKTIIGLETLDYQVGLFDSIGETDQDALVRQTLEDVDDIDQEMDTMLAAWKVGDLEAMDQVLLDNFKEYPRAYKRLVVDRNYHWVPAIVDFINSGQVHFIVVGAGHLPGREGVLQLLKAEGLTVTQL